MAKIYVASSWRNVWQQAVVEVLRREGHDVYDFKNPPGRTGFSWSDVDPERQNWSTPAYRDALDHPVSQAGYDSDFNAMDEANICVLVLPCGRSAHTEAGYMKGQGKPTYVLIPDPMEPELMYKVFDLVTDSLNEIHLVIREGQWHYQGKNDIGFRFNNYQIGKYCIVLDHKDATPQSARGLLFNFYDDFEKRSFEFEPDFEQWKQEFLCMMKAHGLKQIDIDGVDWNEMKWRHSEGDAATDVYFGQYLDF